MTSQRILLMSRTLRRDLPSCYVLKKILEAKSRAKVVICSQRSVFSYLRHWKPHALVYPCASDTRYFAAYAPAVKLFCFSGEGGQCSINYDEKCFIKYPQYYDVVQRILLWGEGTKQYLVDDEQRVHGGKYRDVQESGKIRIVGHPRLDLARYFPGRKSGNSIGICTHFFTLNNFRGDSALRLVFGRPEAVAGLEFEAELMMAVVNIIDYILKETNFSISIRPYPLEAPQMYYCGKGKKKVFSNPLYQDRVSIDDHLDFTGWVAEQELVLSSVTTALSEAYLLGVPMIFIDKMLSRTSGFAYYNSINKILGDVPPQPKSIEEMQPYLQNPATTPIHIDRLRPFLNRYYNYDQQGSVLERVADIVLADLETGSGQRAPFLPDMALDLLDGIIFGLERMRDPLCSNFSYRKGFHRIPPYYDQIVANIFAKKEPSPFARNSG